MVLKLFIHLDRRVKGLSYRSFFFGYLGAASFSVDIYYGRLYLLPKLRFVDNQELKTIKV